MAGLGWLDAWLAASVRRPLLDRDLERVGSLMIGWVLEIGNGRVPRRGKFQPPTGGVTQWFYLDVDARRRPNIRGDLTCLPIVTSSLDTVVCLEVLEYVPEPAAAVREMHRALRPGGTLVLSTPFVHRVDARNDCWRFTEHGLRELLQQGGATFEVLSCQPQGAALAVGASVIKYAIHMQERWRRRVIAALVLPMLTGLLKLDRAAARRCPDLSRFTTGYLVVARR